MFDSIMHVAFYCKHFDEMVDFYTNKLGGKQKVIVKYGEYLDVENRLIEKEIAQKDPNRMNYTYIEIAPKEFIELYPEKEGQLEHTEFNKHIGYSHFSLIVKDIYKTKDELMKNGVTIDTPISMGPSGTYQMWIHDPDDNRIEIMQFTDKSYQVVGHIIK